MADTRWFRFQGRIHAVDDGKPYFRARCGLRPLVEIDTRTLGDGVFPPESMTCRKCLVEIGMDHLEEEPIDAVRERGYLPSSITTL